MVLCWHGGGQGQFGLANTYDVHVGLVIELQTSEGATAKSIHMVEHLNVGDFDAHQDHVQVLLGMDFLMRGAFTLVAGNYSLAV